MQPKRRQPFSAAGGGTPPLQAVAMHRKKIIAKKIVTTKIQALRRLLYTLRSQPDNTLSQTSGLMTGRWRARCSGTE
jgi:hypothetical protein